MKPLVFLHGWAQSRQAWFQQFDAFPGALFLNLPGHGGADDAPADDWVEIIAQQLPDKPCVLVGWSLGGMLALELARQLPERIGALALVSATPCFRNKDDWAAGCDEGLLAGFEAAVNSASARTLNRFFALMLHGDDLNRGDYNALAKQAVNRNHPPSPAGMRGGLDLLAGLDNRRKLGELTVPALILHGEQDAIVSAQAALRMAELIPEHQLHLFPDCGHAPFLTQPELFNKYLKHWWNTL